MKKSLLIILIFISIISTISLAYNFICIHELNKENQQLLAEINHYEEKIENTKNNQSELEKKYENLKTNNDKLLEYEKWNKWTQEIEQKMS